MKTKKTPEEIKGYFQDNGFAKQSDGFLHGVDKNGKKFTADINNIDNFLNADQARQTAILDSTQIVITEEEFYHAKRWLALAYITGGEHFLDGNQQEINHKTVYQQQEILPADDTIAFSGADIAQKMDSVIPHITADNVKNLYRRLVEKRPKFFVSKDDTTEEARSHGKHITKNQTVKLGEYISYAEMDFCSSLLQVSGDVNFVNDGKRDNLGIEKYGGSEYENQGRIAALVGARFEIDDAMESTNLIFGVSERLEAEHSTALGGAHNQRANFGRIQSVNKEFVEGHKKIWDEFYKNQSSAYDLSSGLLSDRLQQRLYISYKKFFADAIADAEKNNIKAHIRVVGLGDGAWAYGKNIQVGQAIGGAVARILKELSVENKNQIDTIEFCNHGNSNYKNGFDNAGGQSLTGKINVENNLSAPFSSQLPVKTGADRKLYVCFAWDSASYVGNEYWLGPPNYFGASGDPAAAACSSIPISMNPQLNSQFLDKIQVVKNGSCEIVDIGNPSLNQDAKFSKSPEAIMAVASGEGGAGAEFTAPAPAVAGFVDTEAEKEKQKNLQTLQDIYVSSNVVFINSDRNFFIRYKTRKEAEDQSEELFQREGEFKIAGGSGEKKYVNFQYRGDSKIHNLDQAGKTESDKEFFGIILTQDDVKKIQAKCEKDLKDFQESEEKKRELLKGLKEKGLEVRHNQKLNGELEFFVTLQEGLGGVDVQGVKASLEAKMKEFSIKGVGGNNKVLVPLNADGNIIYSSTEFSDVAKKNPTYDYSSSSIRKFAIILTQNNARELLTLNYPDEQIQLLKMEEARMEEALTPRDAAHAPADAQNHGEILKQRIIGGVAGGVVGVGVTLLCASALGIGIVSAPVIGTAIVVGGAGILVGSIVAEPIASAIKSCSPEINAV